MEKKRRNDTLDYSHHIHSLLPAIQTIAYLHSTGVVCTRKVRLSDQVEQDMQRSVLSYQIQWHVDFRRQI